MQGQLKRSQFNFYIFEFMFEIFELKVDRFELMLDMFELKVDGFELMMNMFELKVGRLELFRPCLLRGRV